MLRIKQVLEVLSSLCLLLLQALACCVVNHHTLGTKQVSGARKAISLSPAWLINNFPGTPFLEIQGFVLALIFFLIQILSLLHDSWSFLILSMWLIFNQPEYHLENKCALFSHHWWLVKMLNIPSLNSFPSALYLCFQVESKSWGLTFWAVVRRRGIVAWVCVFSLPDE